ncbi:Uncharacterised protein [Chlamydia trachomatis]|nr:Uncharacterised protein [Chlamydia trachomatis]
MKVPFIKDVIVVVVVEISNNYRELAFYQLGKKFTVERRILLSLYIKMSQL